jgi:sugar lactone lactonase YvrE
MATFLADPTSDNFSAAVTPTTGGGTSAIVFNDSPTFQGKTGFAIASAAATVHVAGDTILSNVDVLSASYDSVSFSVAAQESAPNDLFFSPDGLRMYILGSSGDDVNEYILSTAWLVSSATFVTNFSVSSQDTVPVGLFFRPDGRKMYVAGSTNDAVFQYTLATPWLIATASYDSVSFSVALEDLTPSTLSFRSDGTSMYLAGSSGDAIYQYSLSTAWDISTSSFLQSFSVSGQESLPSGLTFTYDGSRMFVCGTTGDDVNVYNLTTPWNISTASFVNVFSVSGQETAPNGIYIKPDGSKMYIVGSTADTVFQYTVPSINIQLTGQTSAGALDVQQDLNVYGNSSSLAASFNSYTEGIFAVTGTTPALSPTNATIQTWTLSGNSTPTSGTWANGQSLTLMIDDGTARTITWTSLAVTWKTNGGAAPTLNTTGFTVIQLWKVGGVIYGARVGDA